jgi:hypothetical protein
MKGKGLAWLTGPLMWTGLGWWYTSHFSGSIKKFGAFITLPGFAKDGVNVIF